MYQATHRKRKNVMSRNPHHTTTTQETMDTYGGRRTSEEVGRGTMENRERTQTKGAKRTVHGNRVVFRETVSVLVVHVFSECHQIATAPLRRHDHRPHPEKEAKMEAPPQRRLHSCGWPDPQRRNNCVQRQCQKEKKIPTSMCRRAKEQEGEKRNQRKKAKAKTKGEKEEREYTPSARMVGLLCERRSASTAHMCHILRSTLFVVVLWARRWCSAQRSHQLVDHLFAKVDM